MELILVPENMIWSAGPANVPRDKLAIVMAVVITHRLVVSVIVAAVAEVET